MFHFFHTGLFTGDPDATSDVMRLVSALVVDQEPGDARERQFFDAAVAGGLIRELKFSKLVS